MTYQETIDFLYSQLPMYQRSGAVAYKKDIGNIIALCDYLGNPHQSLKTIHVGGTNGKGSVSKILSSIFQEAGYKVGLYTSPHYLDFRERIQFNGAVIDKEYIVQFVALINPILPTIQPSFFEITVAMAFSFFAKQNVDIAIIEVGLGGRLDSTNIIEPECSIITNIGYDHQQFLGTSLSQIAAEKAGIIKPKIPVIIGKTQQETKGVFAQKANENRSPLIFADQGYHIIPNSNNDFILENQISLNKTIIKDAPHGLIQQENIRTAFAAFQQLKEKWNLSNTVFLNGIQNLEKNAPLIGRWQIIQEAPKIILDSCHNKQGVKLFFDQLIHEDHEKLHLIYGTVSDKNVSEICQLFPKNAHYYLTQPSVPRKMDVGQLSEQCRSLSAVQTFESVGLALEEALRNAAVNDTIAVFGSVFLVADAMKFLSK